MNELMSVEETNVKIEELNALKAKYNLPAYGSNKSTSVFIQGVATKQDIEKMNALEKLIDYFGQ